MREPASFGEWLRERREALHLSRPELAQRVHCSVPALRKIETGERRPSRQLAELLAAAIRLPQTDHTTFVRVARGELNLERLTTSSKAPAEGPSGPAAGAGLPSPLTPLIGREAEMAQLAQLLADPHCRLLTITGPGGVGKTRLGLEAACVYSATGAAYIVSLAPLASATPVIYAIAEALSFKFSGAASPEQQLVGHLRDRSLLLVLDNFEHLLREGEAGGLPAACALVATILRGSPKVKVLVTSRERLDMSGEWVFELQGLPVPSADLATTQQARASHAVTMFVESARRSKAGFEPQPEEIPAAVNICQLVAGVPLAIELAAAWVPALSCREISNEIERALTSGADMKFLARSTRDVPDRHRSMRAAIDHSWNLLSDSEQRAMRCLSVFRGGFGRDAAESVAGAQVHMIAALVAKSIIWRSGDGRYRLHELVRQYAASRLAEDGREREEARERHSLHYLGLLEERDAPLRSSEQWRVLEELTVEIDNIRAAWDWAICRQRYAQPLTASPALMYLFEIHNWFGEGEKTFHEAADAIRASLATAGGIPEGEVALNLMLSHWGFFLLRLGRGREAYPILSSSSTFLHGAGETSAAAYSTWYLGIDCWILGRFAEARSSLLECLELSQRAGLPWYEAWAREFLGRLALDEGQYPEAKLQLGEALAIMRRLGDPTMTAHALSYLGRATQMLGDNRGAKQLLEEALELGQGIGYRFAVGLATDALGQIAQSETRHDEARELFHRAEELFREMGDVNRLARTLSHDGYNSLAFGDAANAQDSFEAALRISHGGGFAPPALSALAGLAALEIRRSPTQRTLERVLFVLENPASTHVAKSLASKLRDELEHRLPQEEVEAARDRASSLNLDHIVEQVISGS